MVERALEGDGRWRAGAGAASAALAAWASRPQQKMGAARAGLVSTLPARRAVPHRCATVAAHLSSTLQPKQTDTSDERSIMTAPSSVGGGAYIKRAGRKRPRQARRARRRGKIGRSAATASRRFANSHHTSSATTRDLSPEPEQPLWRRWLRARRTLGRKLRIEAQL